MSRFKLRLFFVLLAVLTLSACSLFTPFNAPTQANPYNDFIASMVAQTLTAFPIPSLQPSLTPTFTETAVLFPQTPQEFISFYFDGINSRNYSLTWSLLTDRFKNTLKGSAQNSFQEYANFWNTVKQVNVKDVHAICQGELCAVNTTLQLAYVNGQLNTSTYPFTLTYEHTRNTWMFDFIPTNTVPATATRTKTPTRTATTTPSRTRTPTTSRTPTRTGSQTRTVSATPSRTRTSTPTLTRSLTFTRTPTGAFTPTSSVTITYTRTASVSPTVPLMPTFTPSGSPTFTPTATATSTYGELPSATPTATMTPTFTQSVPASATPSPTPSETPTPTAGT